MSWEEIYRKKLVSIKDAVKLVRSGDFVCTPGGPSAAYDLMTELAGRYEELENVTVSSALMMRPLPHFEAKYKGHIGHLALFMGPLERIFMPQGNIKVNSCSFSNFDDLITQELTSRCHLHRVLRARRVGLHELRAGRRIGQLFDTEDRAGGRGPG